MELNDLVIFKTVVQEGSISKAAKELGYVQPNVTERMKKLEQELETKLLLRESRGVSVLPAGVILLEYTEKILQLLDNAKKDIQKSCEPYRIATTQTILSNYVSDRISENVKDYQIYMENSSRLEHLLKKQQVDMIGTYTDYTEPSFQKVFTASLPIGLHKIKGKAAVEYAKESFFVSHDVLCPFRTYTIDFLQRHHLSNTQLCQVDSYSLMKEFVALGKGIAIFPISRSETENIEAEQIDNIPVYFFTKRNAERTIPKELFC
ncbi:LysR family transcriptional regulator [Heyndrickxia acidicola]|uniref:LysR family transcriptional regulator n=1 Tax=Heyndrickxia acidicola TaxID=209389 RepID=A0ABU6MF21_9BACI|nr:LysR family transcriptional regulator [Heyndrickxia acidicola]MED1203275.1 LysR family transcriptional regulator [Heyndrickxia acidicola]